MARNRVLTSATAENGIGAGQRPVWPHGRSRPQLIELTLSTIGVFPMTHHVECVAILTRA
jgi:hypothetical protein